MVHADNLYLKYLITRRKIYHFHLNLLLFCLLKRALLRLKKKQVLLLEIHIQRAQAKFKANTKPYG